MNFIIEKLSEKHLQMLGAFSCIESEKILSKYDSKTRRRIKKHSKEMEDFLKNESLDEQSKVLNSTRLFIDTDTGKVIAYLSLCNDSIRLEIEERDELNLTYTTVPAIKIARLAVDSQYQGQGIGKMLIKFAAYMGDKIRQMSGLIFLTLDCYEHRVAFYESVGFVRNIIQPIELKYDSPISMRLAIDTYFEKINAEIED
mgnify:CR=1